jgi:hypothetical protein
MGSKYFVLLAKLVATLMVSYIGLLAIMLVTVWITASVHHMSTLDTIVGIVHMFGVK